MISQWHCQVLRFFAYILKSSRKVDREDITFSLLKVQDLATYAKAHAWLFQVFLFVG